MSLIQGTLTLDSLYEAYVNITLMFGIFQSMKITVVGIGWTLGVTFAFYRLFPFCLSHLDCKESMDIFRLDIYFKLYLQSLF